MCLSSTIIGPMRPACQKCTSELRASTIKAKIPESESQTYPQIPVLRISTATSPSLSVAPDWMSATCGSALSSHRLCCGSVYTPMLGLRFRNVDMVVSRDKREKRQRVCHECLRNITPYKT